MNHEAKPALLSGAVVLMLGSVSWDSSRRTAINQIARPDKLDQVNPRFAAR